MARKIKHIKPEKRPSSRWVQVWRIVDSAVFKCMTEHPEYFNPEIEIRAIRNSMNKRAVGALMGYEQERLKRAFASGCDLGNLASAQHRKR